MGSPTFVRPMLLFAGISSLIQSIIWFVMSLLGVLAYRCELDTPEVDDNVSNLLYFLYFQGYDCPTSVPVLSDITNLEQGLRNALFANPQYINSWMATYLAFDITYMLLSVALLIGYCRSKDGSLPLKTIRLWCLNTLAFLIMDFWLTIVWGVDLRNISNFASDLSDAGLDFSFATTVPGTLMAITARGFILWIVNLGVFIYFVKHAVPWAGIYLCLSQRPVVIQANEPDSFRIPRAHAVESWNNGQVMVAYNPNRGFVNEGYGETSFGERYPPRRWDSGRRHSDVIIPPTSQQRGYNDRHDDEGIEYFQPAPHHSRNEPAFPPRGHQNTRTNFDNRERKNFEQGHGSPPKRTHGNRHEMY